MINKDFPKAAAAVEAACLTHEDYLTSDRIEALTGGHGMLTMSLYAVADTITEELQRGGSVKITFANERSQAVDTIMEKATAAAKDAGADGANAALITACMLYLSGSAAQVGIPAGNRKLGASARMFAGVDRCGVANIPTAKMNSKISGFPAVKAIYDAMTAGELSPIDGNNIPENVGGAIYGHSALGEDVVWPAVAENGARIGTQAMLDAMHGVGIKGSPFQAAVLGAAAILEIIHPDAEVPEGEGVYGRTTSAMLVGRSAARTAGLPEKLHMRVTGEEFDTAKIVGDVGLILKDIGGPSVVGMMAFDEIFGSFREGLGGGSTSPGNSPLGHMTSYVVPAMLALSAGEDPEKIGQGIVADRSEDSMNPEIGVFSIFATARKALEITNGPVTKLLADATLPTVTKMIYDRSRYTYDRLAEGKSIADIVTALENDRVATVEENVTEMWKRKTGDDVTVKFKKIAKGARRTSKPAQKYFAFDPLIDVEVTVNGETRLFEHFADEVIPKACTGEHEDIARLVSYVTPATSDLLTAGCCIMNAVIPAAVASVMEYADPADAAAEAEKAAYITAGIPGVKAAAKKLALLTLKIDKMLRGD